MRSTRLELGRRVTPAAPMSHFVSHDAFARTPADDGPALAWAAGRSGGTRGALGRPSTSVNKNVATPEGAAAAGADTPAESHKPGPMKGSFESRKYRVHNCLRRAK
jgi:hypothetical protein